MRRCWPVIAVLLAACGTTLSGPTDGATPGDSAAGRPAGDVIPTIDAGRHRGDSGRGELDAEALADAGSDAAAMPGGDGSDAAARDGDVGGLDGETPAGDGGEADGGELDAEPPIPGLPAGSVLWDFHSQERHRLNLVEPRAELLIRDPGDGASVLSYDFAVSTEQRTYFVITEDLDELREMFETAAEVELVLHWKATTGGYRSLDGPVFAGPPPEGATITGIVYEGWAEQNGDWDISVQVWALR